MSKILKYYVRIFILLFPVLFWPVSIDSFGSGKLWLLVIGMMIGMILWGLTVIIDKAEVVKVNKFLVVWLLLAGWTLVSWWRGSLGVRARSTDLVFGLNSIVALWGWMWLFLQTGGKEERRVQFNFLTISGIILTVLGLVTFLLPTKMLPLVLPSKDLPLLSIGQGWSLAGGLWAQVMVLAVLLFWWGLKLIDNIKKGEGTMKVAAMVVAMVVGLFVTGYFLVKVGRSWLDLETSWVVAVEAFKRSPLWGVGSGNFVQAFLSFRPVSFNMTPQWGMIFGSSGLGILHWWTELGVVGLGLAVWLLVMLTKRLKTDWWVLVFAVAVMVLPLQLMGLFLLVWLLAGVGESKEHKLVLKVGESGFNVMPIVTVVMMMLVTGVLTWTTGKSALTNYYVWNSYLTAQKNDGVGTYNWRLKAVQSNQNMTDFRVLYSQTNMALAKALLADKDISEENKQRASVLVQQAVAEGRAAIALDGNNPLYWSNLATIYRDLIGLVDGAADWTVQALQQAMALEPVNITSRLDLGGLLYGSGRYDEADRMFEQVVINKQDLANGWYNWAYSAKQMNKLADAVQRMQQAVSLVPATSGDYEKASQELVVWKKEYDEAVAKQRELLKQQQAQQEQKQPETLKTPQALPTMSKEERVDVPAKDLEPPKVSVTPAETSPSVTVAPTGVGGP